MNAIITTTLSFFNMHNIKPNFSALAREFIDRHTFKNTRMQEVINLEKRLFK